VVAGVASQTDSWVSDVKVYQTLVQIDDVVPGLKPDMTAEVTITVDTAKEAVLTVPVQAVMGGGEMGPKREVYVKTPAGYERREVKLGLYNEKVIEIRDGLQEGDEVVTNPKVLLAPDDKTKTRDDGGKNGAKGPRSAEGDYPKGESAPVSPKGEGGMPGGPGGAGGTKGAGGKKKGAGGMPPGGGGAPPSGP
jgi:HlyD family secretion protein